jgi:hypothetical protein
MQPQSKVSIAGDGTAQLVLTRGLVSVIDASDLPIVAGLKWYAHQTNPGIFYAARRTSDAMLYLHRLLLDAPDGMDVDHIDGDTLNNRRANLRLASRAENGRNQGLRRNNTSGFKGVHRAGDKWAAQITRNRVVTHLGRFDTPDQAAAAYRLAALRLHGRFARTR